MLLPSSFVDLSGIAEFELQIYYATPNNFTGRILPGYQRSGAWLHRNAAHRLLALRPLLRKLNLKLVIWDAYRPKRATDAMVAWAEQSGNAWMVEEGYIARRSRHNGGVAIIPWPCMTLEKVLPYQHKDDEGSASSRASPSLICVWTTQPQ